VDTFEHVFDVMRAGLLAVIEAAGPWALPALGVIALLLGLAFRDRIASPGGLIFLLAFAAFAVLVRAAQLGRL